MRSICGLYMLSRFLYMALWWLLAPIAVGRLFWRARREPAYRDHIGERFGYAPNHSAKAPEKPVIWIHAVSVGETHAAQPLIEALLRDYPKAQILLTHMSPGGRARSAALFGDRVLCRYLPYDMRCAVRRFLQYYQPIIGLIFETEIWPTLLHTCKKAQIPTVLVNARLSERSYKKYRTAMQWTGIVRDTFASFTRILAQTPADAQRLSALGAHNVSAVGNMKFDITPAPQQIAKGRAWREAIGEKRAVWVAASTREGEEALVLDAFKRSGHSETALLILVPRHAARFDDVAAQLKRADWRFTRRSAWGVETLTSTNALDSRIQVLLGDSMGELTAYYAAADIAFIGGSLLPFGGQNLIEACAIGVPVLFGPYTFNFAQATQNAIDAGAAQCVAHPDALGKALHAIWTDPALHRQMREAALSFSAAHCGATQRTVQALQPLLSKGAP